MRLPIVVGLAAFVCTAVALKRAVPRSPARLESHLEKLRADRYTTVFLGTSCFYRGIIPRVFDEAVGSRSFNLSAPGMSWGEAAQLAGRIDGIDYLIVDGDLRGFDPEGAAARRFVDWHDAATTTLSIRSLPLARSSLGHLAEDVRGFLFRSFAVGAISDRLVGDADEPVSLGDRGFVSLDSERDRSFRERRESFQANPAAYRQAVAALDSGREKLPSSSRMAQSVIDRARASGAKVLIVYAPNVLLDEVEADAPKIDFRDARRYAELYDLGVRFDNNHLNERGAVMFTRALAERFLEWRNALR